MEIGRSLSWCLKVGCLAVLKWSSTGSPTHTSSLFICECGVHFSVCIHMCLVTQSCPNLCNPMDCSLPGSSIHGIILARILEQVAISFSRGSSQLRDQTWVSQIAGRLSTVWATREFYPFTKWLVKSHRSFLVLGQELIKLLLKILVWFA